METIISPIDAHHPDTSTIAAAAELLRAGAVVAFPTETVYGLGADATNEAAVTKIFAAKGRPSDNPLIVHVAEPADITPLVTHMPDTARRLIEKFWPGPLSLVLPKSSAIPDITTASLSTVVVRCPQHPVARALIRVAAIPIAAPSANRSGYVSPTTAQHVYDDLAGRIPLILDAGPVAEGIESTVLDCTTTPPTLLRPGSITSEMIQGVIGEIQEVPAYTINSVRSPGMKYRHYATHAPITLFPNDDAIQQALLGTALPHPLCIVTQTDIPTPAEVTKVVLGANPIEATTKLYETLRALDVLKPAAIWITSYEQTGVGASIMNRLKKAASGH